MNKTQLLSLKQKKIFSEYFKGEVQALNKIKIETIGTEFQSKVWKKLRKIKPNQNSNYSEIAKAISHPKAQRAVGTACRNNPICLIVPCHRVLASNGSISGYRYGVKMKEELIKHETLNS